MSAGCCPSSASSTSQPTRQRRAAAPSGSSGPCRTGCPRNSGLAGITGVEAANRSLADVYLPDHNARFAVAAEQDGSAFVADRVGAWREILCIQEERVVGNDNTVEPRTARLPPGLSCLTLADPAAPGLRVTLQPATKFGTNAVWSIAGLRLTVATCEMGAMFDLMRRNGPCRVQFTACPPVPGPSSPGCSATRRSPTERQTRHRGRRRRRGRGCR